MTELHNHIFSNTTCISKETMLRYINKRLSKNELYKVEKHMLDCELCSDAYEGMQFAQNSSVLFAIDNQIDSRVGAGNSKAPVMRNLMVAASILVIVFGAYFTIDYFNTTVINESGLAINEIDESKLEEQTVMPLREKTKQEDSGVQNQQELLERDGKLNELLEDDEEVISDEKYKFQTVADVPLTNATEQSPIEGNIYGYNMETEVAEVEEEIAISGKISGEREIVTVNRIEEKAKKAKGENEKLLESRDDIDQVKIDNRRQDNNDGTIVTEDNISNNIAGIVNEPADDKSGEALKKEEKKSVTKSRNKSSKKGKFKSNAPAVGYFEDGNVEENKEYRRYENQRKIITIDSYKVVDYTDEYQKEHDLKNANTIETKSISAGFETKADKDIADKEADELTIEITYKATLEKAISYYKNQKYELAIEQFDLILKEHPNEVNGLFYEGLSNYHMRQYGKAEGKLNKVLTNENTAFNEEAAWYKALTLIALKKKVEARQLLESIEKSNGFYKSKAKDELKGL